MHAGYAAGAAATQGASATCTAAATSAAAAATDSAAAVNATDMEIIQQAAEVHLAPGLGAAGEWIAVAVDRRKRTVTRPDLQVNVIACRADMSAGNLVATAADHGVCGKTAPASAARSSIAAAAAYAETCIE